ncbi:MAG: hypothetical protein FWF36_00820 [Propionibacteriaceae bacterium]|nr:hypothetical protein [Propionibacteriaceae bacterium]
MASLATDDGAPAEACLPPSSKTGGRDRNALFVRVKAYLECHPWIGAAGMFVLATLICWLRMGSQERDTLWEEDGSVFTGDWLHRPSPWLIVTPYAGYVNLIPRVTQLIVQLMPVKYWALLTTAAACVVVGLVCGLAYYCSRWTLTMWSARFGLVLVPALLPLAGVEPLGTVCNLHWWAIFAVFWLIMARPKGRFDMIVLALLAFAFTMSEIMVVFVLPLALWRIFRPEVARQRVVSIVVSVGCVWQVVAYLVVGRAPESSVVTPLTVAVKGWLVNVIGGSVTSSLGLVQTILATAGWQAFIVALLFFLVPIVLALQLSSSRGRRLMIAYNLVLSVVLWFFILYMNGYPNGLYSSGVVDVMLRWGMAASLCLLTAYLLAIDELVTRRTLSLRLATLTIALLIAVQSTSFTTVNDNRAAGLQWQLNVEIAQGQCREGATEIAMFQHPPFWGLPGWEQFVVPCDRLLR